jgi:hypothetical protein
MTILLSRLWPLLVGVADPRREGSLSTSGGSEQVLESQPGSAPPSSVSMTNVALLLGFEMRPRLGRRPMASQSKVFHARTTLRSSKAFRCRVPKEEIEQVTLLARVMYKAVLGLHYKRKEQKKSGQLAIF